MTFLCFFGVNLRTDVNFMQKKNNYMVGKMGSCEWINVNVMQQMRGQQVCTFDVSVKFTPRFDKKKYLNLLQSMIRKITYIILSS